MVTPGEEKLLLRQKTSLVSNEQKALFLVPFLSFISIHIIRGGKVVEDKILLMTAHHKKDPYIDISKKYFFPIQVGRELSNVDLGINVDNDGDNISIKNKTFCELTAYYYAWKNLNAEYIGLMQYRRIFTEKSFFMNYSRSKFKYYIKSLKCCYKCNFPNLGFENLIYIKDKNKAEKISNSFYEYLQSNLQKNDIYLPKKVCFKYLNMEQQFILNHNSDDWLLFKKLIMDNYPLLIESTEEISKTKSFYIYNMFIMKKNIFDEYMNILFDILFKMEKLVDMKNKSPYQMRLFGFLGERFLNIYIHFLVKNKNINLKELNVVFLDLEN